MLVLPPPELPKVLVAMQDVHRANVITAMPPIRQVDMLRSLPPHLCTSVLAAMPPEPRRHALAVFAPEERVEMLSHLLKEMSLLSVQDLSVILEDVSEAAKSELIYTATC